MVKNAIYYLRCGLAFKYQTKKFKEAAINKLNNQKKKFAEKRVRSQKIVTKNNYE